MANITAIVTQPNHGDPVGQIEGKPVAMGFSLRNFIDDIVQKLNAQVFGNSVKFPEYAKSDLPLASENTGGQLNVTDETGGYVPAFSDGTNWRRYTDRAIVS
jgi:hypothetical protein